MAAAGADRLGDLATDRTERRSRIRDEVTAALRDRGHEVRTSHGLSDFTVDIAVRSPGSPRWQVAVMLDGPDWSARPTVADRDSAPALLCSIMGWPEVVRFWLPAWIHDRSAMLDRVDEAVIRAEALATVEPETESSAVAPGIELPQPRSVTDGEPQFPTPAAEVPQPRRTVEENPSRASRRPPSPHSPPRVGRSRSSAAAHSRLAGGESTTDGLKRRSTPPSPDNPLPVDSLVRRGAD
ncbi:hypothetical protein AB0J27_18955 [Micromonospora chokoriensis]